MKNKYVIVADDDLDDQLLVKHAFSKSKLNIPLEFVNDGQELIEAMTDKEENNLPSFILLDLNMPRKNGKDCLHDLKSNVNWRNIPVIMFSTSKENNDVKSTYELGASSYIHKPNNFDELELIVDNLNSYWLHTVLLP